MASKSNKNTLLDKNQYDQSEMIEMVDISTFKKGSNKDETGKNNVDYVRLDDEEPKTENKSKKTEAESQKKPKPQASNVQKNPKPSQSQAPCAYPTHSSNPNPNRIQMNGSNFQMQNSAPTKKVSKFPEMEVACNFCTFKQSVPGNTQLYVCCCCNNMNQCYPLYGLFVCGYCQSKVCYPYGTSDMIKCTRCGTVNRVPFQPQRTYMKQFPQAQQKKEQKKQEKFFEDQIVLEHEEEPENPKQRAKKIQEEELFFDDFSQEKSKKQKSETYPDLI